MGINFSGKSKSEPSKHESNLERKTDEAIDPSDSSSSDSSSSDSSSSDSSSSESNSSDPPDRKLAQKKFKKEKKKFSSRSTGIPELSSSSDKKLIHEKEKKDDLSDNEEVINISKQKRKRGVLKNDDKPVGRKIKRLDEDDDAVSRNPCNSNNFQKREKLVVAERRPDVLVKKTLKVNNERTNIKPAKANLTSVVVGDSHVYVDSTRINMMPSVLRHANISGIEGDPNSRMVAYHVTSAEAVESIMKKNSGGFHPSVKGMLGPGIYFAKNCDECMNKAQSTSRNAALECMLTLGRSLVVRGPIPQLNEDAVRFVGCTSIHRHQPERNDEWVVYNNEQVEIVRKMNLVVVE